MSDTKATKVDINRKRPSLGYRVLEFESAVYMMPALTLVYVLSIPYGLKAVPLPPIL